MFRRLIVKVLFCIDKGDYPEKSHGVFCPNKNVIYVFETLKYFIFYCRARVFETLKYFIFYCRSRPSTWAATRRIQRISLHEPFPVGGSCYARSLS